MKNLIEKFDTEFKILLEVSYPELEETTLSKIAEGIIRVREEKIFIESGYDSVYGKNKIFSKEQKIVFHQNPYFEEKSLKINKFLRVEPLNPLFKN